MAKTPLKRRRAASPPPPRKAKPTKPPKITHRSWYIQLDRLLRPLTPTQQDEIREVLPSRQAAQLLRDWPRISEVARQHALVQHVGATSAKLWSDPAVRKRRDAQLRKAASKAEEAATALKEMVTLWSKHVDAPSQAALATWAGTVTVALAREREAIEQYRTRAAAWPKASVREGQPTQPMTYLQ